jgi:hypothetical protein
MVILFPLTGYTDAGYLSDPADSKSQTGYTFLIDGTTISWRSAKQTLTTTSSNHSEIMALYEATRECMWLRHLIDHIHHTTGKKPLQEPTILYEDNCPCIEQISTGHIKGERTKHIAPKYFFTKEQHQQTINVTWIPSEHNTADFLTKALPPARHQALSYSIGLRSLQQLRTKSEGENNCCSSKRPTASSTVAIHKTRRQHQRNNPTELSRVDKSLIQQELTLRNKQNDLQDTIGNYLIFD